MPRLRLFGVAALILAVSLAACGPKPQKGGFGAMGPTPVGVLVIRAQPVGLTTELSGRTSAFLVAEVRPQVTGVIKARHFQEGGLVRAGQPLYQIDAATYRASLNSANAGLAQAQAVANSARLKAERYKGLVAINAVSKQDNDDAQALAQQTAASVQVQRAAVEQARINVGYTQVFAPISGRIGKSSVTPGALVTATQAAPLATIQNLDRVYVDVTQSSADLLKLRRGLATGQLGASSAPVTLVLEDGSTYPQTGLLAFSDITVNPSTGTVGLRAVFPNPQGTLLPGMYVRARISAGVSNNGILAPQASIGRDASGRATAMVVGAGDKAEQRMLTTAQSVGENVLVTSGLKPGDRLIVEGLQKVRPGAPVKPQPLSPAR